MKIKPNRTLTNLLAALLLTAGAIGLYALAERHALQKDLTYAASNSLSEASIAVLARMDGPLTVKIYATEEDARLGNVRKIIGEFLSLYQRYKKDMAVVFIDPQKEPEQARAANIQLNGELVVEYAGRAEHITQINEQAVSSTLLRLAHTRSQLVMYLGGHGERKLDGVANFDLGIPFGAKLKQNGYKVAGLNLALAQEVPANAAMLVITQPQTPMMPGEVDKLLRYVDRGGNLLWLLDAEPLRGLEPLAEKLGLILPPGTVIDPAAAQLRAPGDWAIGASYTPHPVTRNFDLITAFPKARPLAWNEDKDWQRHVLVEAANRGWVSRSGKAKFDQAHDTPGPVVIASALQRTVADREQRIVVVGDAAFLSNTFAGNGGNVDLGLNMVNWLAGEERLITAQPRSSRDSSISLSKNQLAAIGLGLIVVLPLLLAAWGAWLWWKRRRA